jgi:hypothetical protein
MAKRMTRSQIVKHARLENDLAERVKEIIINRTLSGQDYKKDDFLPYSDNYIKFKQRAVGSASPVNLKLTGNMLENFYVDVQIDPVEIEVLEGDKVQFNEIKVIYGFHDRPDKFGNMPLDKYVWNAENAHGKDRDFLGIGSNESDVMFTHEELNDIINELMIG